MHARAIKEKRRSMGDEGKDRIFIEYRMRKMFSEYYLQNIASIHASTQ